MPNNTRFSLKQAREVDKYTLADKQLTSKDQIPSYIFNKLMIVDYHVREFKINQTKTRSKSDENVENVNPMDAVLGIFHSSDIFLRRYLAVKLSECQLSVPFLLPDPEAPSENITNLLPALESITKSWKSGPGNNEKVHEVFATEHPFPVVSFIRLGQPKKSKSSWINKIMSDGDRDHNFFYHKNMKGGNVKRKVVDGLVELSWFLPGGKGETILQQEICFANLRGDARIFEKQRDVLLKISSVLCILLPSAYPDKTMQNIFKSFKDNGTKVILLFNEEIQEDAKEYFDELESNSDGKLSLIEKDEIDNKYEFFQTIREYIKNKIDKVNVKPLVELVSDIHVCGIRLEDDEIDPRFRTIIHSLLLNGIKEAKKLFKLQMHIPEMADLQRELYRPRRYGDKYIKKDNDEIHQMRAENKNARKVSLENMDRHVLHCLQYIAKMDKLGRNKALSMLKNLLEKLTLGQQKQEKQKKQLAKTKFSFGIEHIIRELAQLYQIEESDHPYADAAADILLSGQPLELVDGDSFYIPLEWFNVVFTKLKHKTNDAKIFVVSVVGIQSSGKSTMLNTMFGLEFPVSAARCTNGVFISLIPVSDSLKSNSEFEYVLVVDTEGLRGSSDPQLRERDNELVVFAIGLADVTIVNIRGENSNEMEDFLGIAVHAFLKMKLVEESNKMSCRIVHQNVTAADAEEKLAGDRSNFIKNLDEMTELAATQENCKDKYKRFNDIISFDGEEDVFYLPTLQLGNPPMAPVNPQYGRDVQAIKNGIIDLMCSKESSHHSVSHFQKRVSDIWKALLEEHFIFSLRNTIELRARRSLDEKYLEESVSVMLAGMAELEEQVDVALRRCLTAVQREEKWAESEMKINSKAEELGKKVEKAMDIFFVTDQDSATLDKWRGDISEEIKEEKKRQVTKVTDHCFATLLYLQRIQNIEREKITYTEKVMVKAKQFIIFVHNFENKTKLKAIFLEEWERWILDVPGLQEVKIDVNNEMKRFLSEKNPAVFNKMLEKQGCISEFKKSVIILNNIVCKKFYRALFSGVQWLFRFVIVPEFLLRAEAIRKKAIRKAIQFSQKTFLTDERFTRDYLDKIYDTVTTTIDEETKNENFIFTDSFKGNVVLSSFAESHHFFDKMEDRFIQERNIRGNLEKNLKPELEKYFENIYEKRSREDLAALFFVNTLQREIELALARIMGRPVAEKLLSSEEFKSKGKFHAKILIKLGEDGNFQSYVRYLKDPAEFLKTSLKESIEYHCLDKILPAIVSIFKNEVNKIKDKVLDAIRIANDKTRIAKGKLTFWIQQFVEACSTLIVKKEMFAVAAIEDLDEIGDFQKKIVDFLNQRVNCLIDGGVNRVAFRKWNPSPHELIFNEMFACQCLCPFCKALCDGCPGHKTHSTQSHRPVGVSGVTHEMTRKLSTDICTECVAGNKTFQNVDTSGEPCYYRDYRSVNDYYNSWVITGNKSLKPSMYWKWFMATFWKELAEQHGTTPKRPNFFWRFISFDQAKKQLMSDYDL